MIEDRITKIKVDKKNRLEVHFERTSENGGLETFAVKSTDPATTEFYNAMIQLIPTFLRVLDMPMAYGSGMEMVGLRIKYKDPEEIYQENGERTQPEMGVVMLAEKIIPGFEDPLKLASPVGSFYGDALKAINALCGEAMEYVRGKRAEVQQIDLFEEVEASAVTLTHSRGDDTSDAVTITPQDARRIHRALNRATKGVH